MTIEAAIAIQRPNSGCAQVLNWAILPSKRTGGIKGLTLLESGADGFNRPKFAIQYCRFGLHFPMGQRSRLLDEAVGEGGFAMVNMGNDAKISNEFWVLHSSSA